MMHYTYTTIFLTITININPHHHHHHHHHHHRHHRHCLFQTRAISSVHIYQRQKLKQRKKEDGGSEVGREMSMIWIKKNIFTTCITDYNQYDQDAVLLAGTDGVDGDNNNRELIVMFNSLYHFDKVSQEYGKSFPGSRRT